MTIIVNDYVVNYQKQGKGPVVVLLHGWGDSLSTFRDLTSKLSRHYTVITLDLPGFGGSDAPKQTFDLEKFAEHIADFLQKIDCNNVYAYIGHSNGGAIAMRGLASGILRSEKLVLLASSGIRSTYKGRKRALRYAAKVAKYPTKLLPQATQAKLKRRAYRTIGSDLFVAEHLQETFKKVVSEDVAHEAAMISQPALLLYGSLDKATPPAYGEKFHGQIENSELKIIEGADHFLHHTHGNKVASEVLEFLEKA